VRRRLQPPPDTAEARKFALRALGRREHSAHELAVKLGSIGVEAAEATRIVQDLRDDGWQDDARYAALLARSRIAQGHGPIRIQAELAARGVDDGIIRECLEQLECDWDEQARAACRKHFGIPASDPGTARKQWTFLSGRGFSAEQIRRVLADSAVE